MIRNFKVRNKIEWKNERKKNRENAKLEGNVNENLENEKRVIIPKIYKERIK